MIQKKLMADAEDYVDPAVTHNEYVDVEYIGDPSFLCDQIKDKHSDYKLGRMIWDQFWYENVAWLTGRQYMRWDNQLGQLVQVLPATDRTVQIAINKIIGKHRTVATRLTASMPTAQVLPNSPSEKDLYAARCGRKILQSNYDAFNYKAVYRKAAGIDACYGMGWLKTVWDECGGKAYADYEEEPEMEEIAVEAQQEGETFEQELDEHLNDTKGEDEGAGPKKGNEDAGYGKDAGDGDGLPDEQEGAEAGVQEEDQEVPQEGSAQGNPAQPKTQLVPKMDKSGRPVMKMKEGPDGKPIIKNAWFEGQVEKMPVSPFNMYYDRSIMEWKDAFDCIQTEFKSIAEIKNTVPNCQDLTEVDAENDRDNPWKMIFDTTIDRNAVGNKNGLTVMEYWCKSCEEFPQGLHVIVVKDKIRVARPMPVLYGERLPYSCYGYIDIPGTFRGMGLPELLIPIQSAYNKTLSQIIENNELTNNVKVLKKSTTRFSDIMTNEVGQIVEWEGMEEPKQWQPVPIGSYAFELLKILDSDFDEVSMVNKTAQGGIDPALESGEMTRELTENEIAIHQNEIDSLSEAIADSCSLELRYVQEKMPDEILIRWMGPNGKFMTDKFKGAVLRNNFDVRMPPGMSANNSRSNQKKDLEMILPLVTQAQAQGPQQSIIIKKAIDYLTYGEEERLDLELNRDDMRIRRIIDQIKKCEDPIQMAPPEPPPPPQPGQPPPPPKPPEIALNPQWMPMPFDDFPTWDSVLKDTLKSEEFDEFPVDNKHRLMTLWTKVNQQLIAMQQTASMPPGGSPGPSGPQSMGPKPSMAGAPPHPAGHAPAIHQPMGPQVKNPMLGQAQTQTQGA